MQCGFGRLLLRRDTSAETHEMDEGQGEIGVADKLFQTDAKPSVEALR